MTKTVRNLGVSLRKDGSFIRVSGYIDEFAEYSPLLTIKPPLRLNLREIVSVNSHGIRKWIRFIRDYGVKALELHECPPVFVDAANMIPDMVSANGNMKRIKSVVTPHSCVSCQKDFPLVIETSELVLVGGGYDVPQRYCPRCGSNLEVNVDPDDHFLFMTVA